VSVEKYVFKGKESNCCVIILFGDPLDERIQDGRQIFEKQHKKYHTTYILQFVFLIIAIVFNAFIMIIISVNIFIDCLISVPYVSSRHDHHHSHPCCGAPCNHS